MGFQITITPLSHLPLFFSKALMKKTRKKKKQLNQLHFDNIILNDV